MTRHGSNRIDLIDAVRGFSIILMVIHHLFYDAVAFLGAPAWLFSNPVFDFLHFIFAGIFVALSGLSSRLSRSNIKRGIKVIIIAAAISFVTTYMEMPILFGILHLLGFSMVFYGYTCKLWNAIPPKAAPFIYIITIVISSLATNLIHLDSNYLWILGWTSDGFVSYDFFPVLPWFFVFLLGSWAGIYVRDHRLPDWFYDSKIPLLPAVGRKSLLIYIFHQPILYLLVLLVSHFRAR